MKIIYQAFDGTQFTTSEECEKYESCNSYQAWNFRGEKLPHNFPDIDDVAVVYFPSKKETDDFFNHVESLGESNSFLRGIKRKDSGLFFWNDWMEQYNWVNSDSYKPLMKALIAMDEKERNVTEAKGSFAF